jgi:hypothetical protein
MNCPYCGRDHVLYEAPMGAFCPECNWSGNNITGPNPAKRDLHRNPSQIMTEVCREAYRNWGPEMIWGYDIPSNHLILVAAATAQEVCRFGRKPDDSFGVVWGSTKNLMVDVPRISKAFEAFEKRHANHSWASQG